MYTTLQLSKFGYGLSYNREDRISALQKAIDVFGIDIVRSRLIEFKTEMPKIMYSSLKNSKKKVRSYNDKIMYIRTCVDIITDDISYLNSSNNKLYSILE